MTLCAWHGCGMPFEANRPWQKFCSPECSGAQKRWAKHRGEVLVNEIVANGSASYRLRVLIENLQKERQDAIDRRRIG